MTQCDLERVYGPLASQLPLDSTDEVVLSRDILPAPPRELRSEALSASWNWHHYQMPVPRVDFYAEKETYRQFGLLVLSKVLHGDARLVTIRLGRSSASDGVLLRTIVLDYYYDASRIPGYSCRPDVYTYSPGLPNQHPWQYTALTERDLPQLCLRHSLQGEDTFEEMLKAQIAVGFGSDYGNILIAELMLNIGLPENEKEEVDLETSAGAGGVCADSAEMRFFVNGRLLSGDEST